ncbi:MAG: hypothetical protein KJ607_05285 [Bacteroidetes bacterium]|nr:hypothetical protein [Bacteroidota bacterium]
MNESGIRHQLINDIRLFDPVLLAQAYHYISLLKNSGHKQPGGWKNFIGCISDKDAKEQKALIDNEFGNIEGEW